MKVVYLNVKEGKKPEIRDISNELNTFHELIKCDLIDIVRRKIGGREYDIIVDDEGLFDEPVKVSMVDDNYDPILVGNLIICNCDESGELQSLTDKEAYSILNHTYLCINDNSRTVHYVIKQR